ncbi:MAG: class IV adenylate cyclase [Candidatus Aminicenantes bacterium]|nr:MAG: class IV adenylate cyclase [Candidatus Aminicenantes bacterium]
MVETEVKIRIDDLNSLKDKILNLNVKLEKDRHYEENTLFDLPTQNLYKKRQALRVRTVGKKTFLTFKGPPKKSRKFKIRTEYETEVKNEKQLRKILKSLGLIPVFTYQKFRTVYRQKHLKICLDETSIGNFMELEGERNQIVRFTNALGIPKKEFIKLDYIQLLKKETGEISETP